MKVSERTQGYMDANHPSAEQLNAFVLGQLDEGSSAEIERHVSDCQVCGKLLESSPDDWLVAQFQDAHSSTVIEGAAAPVSPSRPTRFVRGYQLLEQLGEGGMGVIWRARQEGLDRFVALKRIRSARPPSAGTLARFRREAEAVSRLQHANIVQIYDVGEQDGEPYLALEYIEGGSLAQKLAGGPLLPRQAAELIETLARTMHYAHEHGIIHRDLKPSNILLASGGCEPPVAIQATGGLRLPLADSIPKISDFGLAKQLGEETTQTNTGAILGTPSYMAPEQAAGEKANVGPSADVYALGAILYEALTGRPPFRGPSVLDTLVQVREREPVSARQLQPSVPRDLDTICLKCLHKDPQKRYGSAADLAEDLRRFREGQPIRARRVGLLERLLKWARRRRAWAALAIVSTLALAVLLGGGLWYQARLRVAVKQTEAHRERADANYRHARQAIHQMLDRIAKFQAPGVPQIEVFRRELYKDALAFFKSISETEGDADQATRFDFAKAYGNLGELLRCQNQPEAAWESQDRARLFLEGLCAEDPANREYRLTLSLCLERLAECEAERGRLQKCLLLREQNLEVCQELCRLAPGDSDCQSAFARGHLNLGCSCNDTNRRAQAEFHWKEAVRILEKLVREHPDKLHYQYSSAISSSNLAMLYRDDGRINEADAIYRVVESRLTKLVEENADHKNRGSWTWGLVQTLRNWGGMLVTVRRSEEASSLLNRAVAIMDKWRLEDPQNRSLQELLLGCLVARMNNNTLLHRRNESDKDWQRAVALSVQLNSWRELCIGALWDARLGDHALAVERAEQLAKQKSLTDEDRKQLARVYALAAGPKQDRGAISDASQKRRGSGDSSAKRR